jgi:hypothetical protein
VPILVVRIAIVNMIAIRARARRDAEKVNASQVRKIPISKVMGVAVLYNIVVRLGAPIQILPGPAHADPNMIVVGNFTVLDGCVAHFLKKHAVSLVIYRRPLHKR